MARGELRIDAETELLVETGGRLHGRYLLGAASRPRPVSPEQRRVAVALADQVGAALG